MAVTAVNTKARARTDDWKSERKGEGEIISGPEKPGDYWLTMWKLINIMELMETWWIDYVKNGGINH